MGVCVKILHTAIRGVEVVNTIPITDHRGALTRFFCEEELSEILNGRRIVQINHSRTEKVGAVRGLHYQDSPCAEMKLVRCLKGKVWDVAVDLRKNSPCFLRWYAEELTPYNARMLVIPEGCAHGFQVLEAGSELLYLHTARYNGLLDAGVRYSDPKLDIQWPLPVRDLSERDQKHPLLSKDFSGITV